MSTLSPIATRCEALLLDVGVDPHRARVEQGQDRAAGRRRRAGLEPAADDDAVERRGDRGVADRDQGGVERGLGLLDLGLGDLDRGARGVDVLGPGALLEQAQALQRLLVRGLGRCVLGVRLVERDLGDRVLGEQVLVALPGRLGQVELGGAALLGGPGRGDLGLARAVQGLLELVAGQVDRRSRRSRPPPWRPRPGPASLLVSRVNRSSPLVTRSPSSTRSVSIWPGTWGETSTMRPDDAGVVGRDLAADEREPVAERAAGRGRRGRAGR